MTTPATPTPITTETTTKKTSTKMPAHARDQRARPRASPAASLVVVDPSPAVVDPSPVVVDPSPVVVDPSPVAVDPNPAAVDPNPAAVDPNPAAVDLSPEEDPNREVLRNAVEDPDQEAHPRRKSPPRPARVQRVGLARSPNVDLLDLLPTKSVLAAAVLAAVLHLRARAKARAKQRANKKSTFPESPEGNSSRRYQQRILNLARRYQQRLLNLAHKTQFLQFCEQVSQQKYPRIVNIEYQYSVFLIH